MSTAIVAGLLTATSVALVTSRPTAQAAARLVGPRTRPRTHRARPRSRPDGPARPPIADDLPELIAVVDLALRAGCNLTQALRAAASTAPAMFRPALQRCVVALDDGATTAEALGGLTTDWGAPGGPLLRALDDHLRDGTPLIPVLERVAVDARADRRRTAERRARRLPVLLLFPLVLCTLPAFGLLTVAPLVASTLDALDVRPLEADASFTP